MKVLIYTMATKRLAGMTNQLLRSIRREGGCTWDTLVMHDGGYTPDGVSPMLLPYESLPMDDVRPVRHPSHRFFMAKWYLHEWHGIDKYDSILYLDPDCLVPRSGAAFMGVVQPGIWFMPDPVLISSMLPTSQLWNTRCMARSLQKKYAGAPAINTGVMLLPVKSFAAVSHGVRQVFATKTQHFFDQPCLNCYAFENKDGLGWKFFSPAAVCDSSLADGKAAVLLFHASCRRRWNVRPKRPMLRPCAKKEEEKKPDKPLSFFSFLVHRLFHR